MKQYKNEVLLGSRRSSKFDYNQAIKLASGLIDFERVTHLPGHSEFHLERMTLLMERLGNPHVDIPTVHIAGTNGKGSTAALVTSVLTEAKYMVGLYTSPSLHEPTERIRVGLTPISKATFAILVSEVWQSVDWVGRNGGYGGVSYFELLTAMAFMHFKRIGVKFQVIEVGLGGRLDATNIVEPSVSVITSISLDHTRVLGDKVTLIAGEKAGIIKRGLPVVIAPQVEEVKNVLVQVAWEKEAPVTSVTDIMSWSHISTDGKGQSFDLQGPNGSYTLTMPLLGSHQLENAATAIATVETLCNQGHEISRRAISQGFRRVVWPGRLETISCNGRIVVVDGAHNPDAMRRLVQTVKELFLQRRVLVIFGALGSHNVTDMASYIKTLSSRIIAVKSRDPRAIPSGRIANICREIGFQVIAELENVGCATRHAVNLAQDDDIVLITGSLSVVAEAVEEITGIDPEFYPDINRSPNDICRGSNG